MFLIKLRILPFPMVKIMDVSVIIPVFNGEPFIEKSIESALSQKEIKKEVIVVDDGSSDRTPYIVQKYVNCGNVILIEQENLGANVARNKGIGVASGQYIKFLDADDFLADDCLKYQFEKSVDLAKNEIVYGYWFLKRKSAYEKKVIHLDSVSQFNALINKNLSITSPLYPKDAICSVSGFDETLKFRQEWDLNLRLSYGGYKFQYHNKPTFFQIDHDSSLRISNRKLDLIKELQNITAIKIKFPHGESQAEQAAWAQKFWNIGRNFLALGEPKSAKIFFSLAKVETPKNYKRNWPLRYKILVFLIGPYWSDRLYRRLKNLNVLKVFN